MRGAQKVKTKVSPAPYLFLIPWFIGISVFRIYPIIMSFFYSLHDMSLTGGIGGTVSMQFVGLRNYAMLIFEDNPLSREFQTSIVATLRYVILGTPAVLVAALFIAFVLNFKLKGVNLFRTAYYVPSILGGNVAVAIIWAQLFGATGPINTVMQAIGLEPVSWITSMPFAPFVIVFLSTWQFGSVMLIFLAALQNVSPSLYEAASIDGARKWRQFLSITVPIITPVILFNSINVLLRHFQEFNGGFLITRMGPAGNTHFLNILIFQHAFERQSFGLGAAVTWLMLAAIGVLTIILFTSSKRWVHYSD